MLWHSCIVAEPQHRIPWNHVLFLERRRFLSTENGGMCCKMGSHDNKIFIISGLHISMRTAATP